jgi:YD repeat-containing protein
VKTYQRICLTWMIIFLVATLGTSISSGQGPLQYRYFYDDLGQLIKVVDSSGAEVDYVYDALGNIVQITRGQAPAAGTLAILNFTPQSGGVGTTVTVQGQQFSSTPSSNAVQFNGTAATVVSATTSTLVVTVPVGASTGPISVTVAGQTATSSNNFNFIPIPAVLSVTPRSVVSSASAISIPNFQVSGSALTGATFSFSPALNPPVIAINSATIDPSGSSASLSLAIAPGAVGGFTLIATNSAGSSSPIGTAANTLNILDPNGDADGDGLTNAFEIAIGTDPLNPTTLGDGIPDGWKVFYGLNPLDSSVAGSDYDGSGLTVLQDFQMGLSPRNPNRVPPSVAQVTPANGASNVFVNNVVVLRFAEPLLTGTSLFAAQTAVTNALGTNASTFTGSRSVAAVTLQNYMNRTCCGNSVIPGTVIVTGPTGAIAGTVATSSDSLSVTFAPTQPFIANTTFNVQAKGVRDSAGNLMTQAFTSSFSTGAGLDNTQPQISLTDPANNATNVPTNAHYRVQFTKAIDPASLTPASFIITDNLTNSAVGGIVQVDASGLTASFIPNLPLPLQRGFTVTFTTAIKDLSGNSLAANASFSFTTGYNPENNPPHLVANSPLTGATGIPVNAVIALQFSQPLDVTTVVPNIQVSTGGQSIPVQMALSDGDQRVTITPAQGLNPILQYTVTIAAGITDLAGLALDNPGNFSFQTAAVVDTTQLSVTAVDPINNAAAVPTNSLARVQFNKPVDATSITSTNLYLYPYYGGAAIAETLAVSADGLSVTLTPGAALETETYYCLYVNGVVDLEGQNLAQDGRNLTCFTTGAGPQTATPTVVAVSPQNGATGVPVNAVVQVAVSVPVSVVSVGANGITLTANGVAVPGTVSASGNVVTFTPTSALAVNTGYTVNVGGFTDVAGNAVQAFTSGFTTANTPVLDQGPLQVTGITPASGSTGVAVNTAVVVTFNEAVDALTVNDTSVRVYASGYIVAGTYAVSGNVVTFTPATVLPGSATIQVYVDYYGYVYDLAGNAGTQYATSTFTTAATEDTTAPTVVSVVPGNGTTGVGLNGLVVVTFSKSMNPSTLTTANVALLANGSKLGFGVSVSADNQTMTLYSLSLPGNTVVTLALTHNVTDLSGNALADYESQFTTAAAADTTQGRVVNQRPGNGATGVGVNTGLVLFVNKALNAGTVSGALHVTANGQVVSGSVSVVDNGQTIEFTPGSALAYGALVQVFLDTTAVDTVGNAVIGYQGSFTVVGDPAVAAPGVVNVSPMYGATGVPVNAVVRLQYSEALSAGTVNSTNVYLYSTATGLTVPAALTLDATGTLIQMVPNAALTANTQYYYYAYNLQGVNGTKAGNYFASFVTGAGTQGTAPQVTVVSPADGLGNVAVNANISVQFSGAVDPTTVNGTTIQVTGGSQTVVPSAISFSNNDQLVEITPQAPLPTGTAMTLVVSGVKDQAGNTVATHTTHFTTGTLPETTNPVVINTNPLAGTTGVPVNAAISLQASAPIDPTSISASTYQVYDNTLGQTVKGTYSQSTDGATVYFVPNAPLAANRGYTVYTSNYGMTDLAGNLLFGGNFTFTTGYATSTAAPQVTAVSPANGVTGVPINAQITAQFNEPVNNETLGQVTLTANGSAVSVNVSLASGLQTLIVTPAAELLQSTGYTLTIAGVQDLAGNAMTAAVTSTFTTGTAPDFTQPTVVAVDPASGSSVPTNVVPRVQFNKQVAVSAANFELYPYYGGAAIAETLAVSADGLSVTLTPGAALETETYYCLYVNGVVDLEGQNLAQDGRNLTCFTTGAGPQTATPTVVAVSPQNGATGVPVNAVVQVAVSVPVSVVSVGANGITLTANGVAVPGTVSASGNVVTFTPTSALAVNTGYTVNVGGFTDVAGNAVQAFTSGFTTANTPVLDQGPLQVTGITPASGSTGVAVNTAVVVTFNEAVDALTVNDTSVRVYASGYIVAGTYAVSGNVVTFTPATVLPGSATIQVYVDYYGYVYDLAGNAGTQYATSTFTTAATEDTTAPTVVSVVPGNGTTGVGLNGLVVVTFSKSMNPSTLTTANVALLANGSKLGFGVSVSADNQTMTLYSLSLPGNTVVTLALTHNVTDLSGNALADYESQFTTAAAADTTQGRVVNQRPGNGATGVGVNTGLVLFVNKALNAGTVSGALHVTANGQVVSGSVSVVDNGQTIEFTPGSALAYGALVQVFLDTTAVDTVGNAVIGYQGSFTVVGDPAVAAPGVVNVSPMYGATGVPVNAVVRLQYSEALSAGTVNSTNVYLYSTATGLTVPAALTLDATGTLIQMVPNAALTANTQYYYYAYNLQGVNGTKAGNYFASFVTGAGTQGTAPQVTVVSPADGLGNVAVNANISVQFSGAVDPTTVNGTTIQVTGGSQTVVPSAISFSNNDQLVEITPQAPLPTGTAMTLVVSGVKDQAGNTVATHTTHFTTGTLPETTNPVVINTNPLAGTTGVPVNAAISLQASAPIDPTSISASTYQVYDNTLGQTVKGTYSQSTDGATVYFVPNAPLATGRKYSINFNQYGMTDLSGNLLGVCCGINNYSFTTGVGPSNTPPQVTGVSPRAGLQGVPINAQITVQFNEPVNSETLGQVTLTANGNGIPVSVSLSAGDQTLTVTPAAELLQSTGYTLTITGVQDLAGNVMTAAVTSTFTTGTAPDFTQPTVSGVIPSNQTLAVLTSEPVQVFFNKQMNALTINASTFTVSTSGQALVSGTIVVSSDGTSATFTPNNPLNTSTVYTVQISSSILDLEGIGLTFFQSSFTTGTQ